MDEINGADMDPGYNQVIPYRLAVEIQEHIIRQAETEEYFVGRAERDDMAVEYVLHLLDQNAVEPEHLAWQGLQVWRNSVYRRQDG